MNINMARINVSFNYYVKSKSGELDSIVRGISTFSSTKEVLQVNRFNNSNLEELANDNSCTYIKTPAGIFTEVELPIKEIIENTDTLNSVRIIFTKYNSTNSSQYKYATPTQLLMVRKCDMYSFFQRNKLYDNKTSFITSYNSTNNKYVYNNIAHLINYCADELRTNSESDADWENKNPDWNKVVLIPVSINSDSSTGSIVSLGHEHGLTSARLVGGENHPIAIRIVSSKFRNE